MKHLFKVNNIADNICPSANMVNYSILTDSNKNIKFFDSNYSFCVKLKGSSLEDKPLFAVNSYTFQNKLFVAGTFGEIDNKRVMYAFDINNLEIPDIRFKKVIDSENYLYNYSLQGAIGVDNNNNHLCINLPCISEKNNTLTADVQCGIIYSKSNKGNVWRGYTIENNVEVKGIYNERLCPTSCLYVYGGYTYFVAYDYGIEGVENNKCFRIAYLCRTQDMVTFETKPILDVTTKLGAITSMSDKKLQITEPDIVITENGKAYFVIRLSGNYNVISNVEDIHKNNGYFYGEIDNVNDYFNDPTNYPQWDGSNITNIIYGSNVNIQKVNCEHLTIGGHLNGVLPRIFLNPSTLTPMVVLYSRTSPKIKSMNQLYLIPDPVNSTYYYKIGKEHNKHQHNNSPEGGNMAVKVFQDYLSIICPHNRTNEVCCFFIPWKYLNDNIQIYESNVFINSLENIEENSVEITI